MANNIRVESFHHVPGGCGQCGTNYETAAIGSPVAGEATHTSLCEMKGDTDAGAWVARRYKCPNCKWSQTPIHKKGA